MDDEMVTVGRLESEAVKRKQRLQAMRRMQQPQQQQQQKQQDEQHASDDSHDLLPKYNRDFLFQTISIPWTIRLGHYLRRHGNDFRVDCAACSGSLFIGGRLDE